MKTTWNLKLLYASLSDPAIERDARAIERVFERFEKKYRHDTAYLKKPAALASALGDYETVLRTAMHGKPLVYAWMMKELDSSNNKAEALIRKLEARFTKATNRIQFFYLQIGKIPAPQQKRFLENPILQKYRYDLERTFETAQYNLSESEEKILSLKSTPARSMWVSGVESLVNKQEVRYGNKKISLSEAMGIVLSIPDVKRRRELSSAIMAALRSVSDFSESEMNAVFTDKKINDELRGFSEPYDATILGYENEAKSVLALVETVTKHFSVSKRFFEIKRSLLGLKHLTYADRAAPIGKSARSYPFSDSVDIVRDAFTAVDGRYARILDEFLRNGQIDVLPKRGKTSGAFCASWSGNAIPTFVLLNHTADLRSLSTLAHEMGHAIHSERSKQQPIFYQGYSTAVAETASTFFEGVAFEHAVRDLPESEKIIALHDRLQEDIATIFRQVAFFNFELELHRAVRERGWVPKENIAAMLNRHMASYMGKSVKLEEDDGYLFTSVSHFRRPFYVYSYAYGQLISKALHARYKEDPGYSKEIDRFLSAGCSKSPEDIFADIGIDVRNPAFFEEGIQSIARDVKELAKLVSKR